MDRLSRLGFGLVAAIAAVLPVGVAVPGAAAGEARLAVVYRPPVLSVEAHGVPLSEVLARIGAAVGFEVVGGNAASEPVDLVIREASLDGVLDRLLRGENHTLLYREGSGGSGAAPVLDRVVLLGPSERGGPAGPVAGASPAVRAPASAPAPATTPPTVPSAPAAAATPTSIPSPSSLASAGSEATSDDQAGGGGDVTVADMLKAHAMAALQASQGTPPPAAPTAGRTPGSRDLEADLAETTRRAQQSLSALVEGLAAATRSLQESAAAPRK